MLTTAQATVLGRSVVAFVERWDLSGVMTFIDQLATDPRPAIVLWQQVVTRAADPRSLTPKALLEPLPTEAVIRALPADPPPNSPTAGVGTVWCATHLCNTTLRPDGERACCYFDRMETASPSPVRPVVASFRGAVPPPVDFRQRVQAAKERSNG